MANKKNSDSLIQTAVTAVLVAGVVVYGASLVIRATMGNDDRDPIVQPTDDGKDDRTGNPSNDLANSSLLAYLSDDEKVAKLVHDMEDGKVPTECDLLYDQMGANPSVKLTDEQSIREVYELVQGITVVEDKEVMPITDSYHHVWFTLQDGTKVGWTFEGAGCVDQGREVIPVEDDGYLWAYVRQLYSNGEQSGMTGQLSDGSYPILLSDEEDIVTSCPTSAMPGETVTIVIGDMTDVYPVVKIDDEDVDVRQRGMEYIFTMPDHEVHVSISLSTYDLGGA